MWLSRLSSKTLSLTLILALVMSASAMAKDKKDDSLPKVLKDGLHLQPNTKASAVYALPGASLEQYDEVWLVDAYVQFSENWQKDYNLNEIGLSGRITDKDMQTMKTRMATEFTKVFSRVLTEKGHKLVTEAGKDVLIVRPAILDLDPTAPDLNMGWETSVVTSAGSMALYMELYDSTTNKLLARIIDRKEDREAFAEQATRGTNTMAADRILTGWAEALADHLGSAQVATD